MTRLAILADIHGNLPALQAVMADMTQFQFDHVVVVGDVVNWGPHSAEVMEIVTREGWTVIRGNNELYLLEYNTPRQPAHWKTYDLLPWLYEQLQGRWHSYLALWPDELSLRFPDAPAVRVFHGAPGNPWQSLHPLMTDAEVGSLLVGVTEHTILAGHSHLAMSRRVGPWHIINPGSVGVPLDGDFTARYVLLEGDESGWQPTFRKVAFDNAAVFEAFERQRFVERYGAVARLVVKEFETARLQVHPFNLWKRACYDSQPVTWEMLAEFEQTDPWPYIPPEYHLNRD